MQRELAAANLNDLHAQVHLVWYNIPHTNINNLFDSMLKQISARISACTQYWINQDVFNILIPFFYRLHIIIMSIDPVISRIPRRFLLCNCNAEECTLKGRTTNNMDRRKMSDRFSWIVVVPVCVTGCACTLLLQSLAMRFRNTAEHCTARGCTGVLGPQHSWSPVDLKSLW